MSRQISANTPEIVTAKREMRAEAPQRREQISAADRDAAADAIAACGIDFARPAEGATVSAYCAIGAELDPDRLLSRLADEGFQTCLPVLQPLGNPLLFRAWSPGEPLVERKWGIREPLPEARLVEPDIVLVPLLAFDAQCRRLGYGGGYYDRTLAGLRALKPVTAIGLAYDEQLVDAVPCEAHDAPLDWILTPSATWGRTGRVTKQGQTRRVGP